MPNRKKPPSAPKTTKQRGRLEELNKEQKEQYSFEELSQEPKQHGRLEESSKEQKENASFEALSKELETALDELLNEESVERFRNVYEKLREALEFSHKSEQELKERVWTLSTKMKANADKVDEALRLSIEDAETIVKLQQEREKSSAMLEYLQEKDTWSKQTISCLRDEIAHLQELVGKSMSLAKLQRLQKLMDEKSTRFRSPAQTPPRESSTGQKPSQEGREYLKLLEAKEKRLLELEEEKQRLRDTILENKNLIRQKTVYLNREVQKRTQFQKELEQITSEAETQRTEISDFRRQVDSYRDLTSSLEASVRELRSDGETKEKQIEFLNTHLRKMQEEGEKLAAIVDSQRADILELNTRICMKESELKKVSDSLKSKTKHADILNGKIKMLIDTRKLLRQDKENSKRLLEVMGKKLDEEKKVTNENQRLIRTLTKERDEMNKRLISQMNATEIEQHLSSIQEKTNQSMSHEIRGFRRESEKHRRIIVMLERERDRLLCENGTLAAKFAKHMEECEVQDMMIQHSRKREEHLERRLSVKQTEYELAHLDKNTCSRQLKETQDAVSEAKVKHRIMDRQCQHLKDEAAVREKAVLREHKERLRFEKERDAFQGEVQQLKSRLKEFEEMMKSQKEKEQNLQKAIKASHEMIKCQKQKLDTITGERRLLGAQLVRRSEELSLLSQKVKLLQTVISNGNKSYERKLKDLYLLSQELRRQRHKSLCLSKQVVSVAHYKRELFSAHRKVMHESLRSAALETELSNPHQIHRWRGLQFSDPSRFELLIKVQTLQKRLIARTQEVAEKEVLLQQKDQQYLELQAVLRRQPGPEVSTRLWSFQRELRTRNRQLKSLAAELNFVESDSKKSEHEAKRLEKELRDMSNKYYKEKKRRQQLQNNQDLYLYFPVLHSEDH